MSMTEDDSDSQLLKSNLGSCKKLVVMLREQLKNDIKVVMPHSFDPEIFDQIPKGVYKMKVVHEEGVDSKEKSFKFTLHYDPDLYSVELPSNYKRAVTTTS